MWLPGLNRLVHNPKRTFIWLWGLFLKLSFQARSVKKQVRSFSVAKGFVPAKALAGPWSGVAVLRACTLIGWKREPQYSHFQCSKILK